MKMNEYAEAVTRTMKCEREPLDLDQAALVDYAIGLCGEAGEFIDLVKKAVFHKHAVDKTKLIEELGDVLWYVAALANTFEITMEELGGINIAKLKRRYPDKYTHEQSQNRKPEEKTK
jgi:NTP pyrophosphatase (non-canonical NTP hydrolase)